MAKYKVKVASVNLPYFPSATDGQPLHSGSDPEKDAARDEYGRLRRNFLNFKEGQEFYAGTAGDEELFFTHDKEVVNRYLSMSAIEDLSSESVSVSSEQDVKSKGSKSTNKS